MNQIFTDTGMTCGHCEKAVTNTIDPTAKVTIDRATNKVKVASTKPRNELAQAIVQEGYAVAH